MTMPATTTAPRTRRSGAPAMPATPPTADEADWLKSPETRAAMAECEDALAHPEKHTWHTSLHELFAGLYAPTVYLNAVALPDGSALIPRRPAIYAADRDGDGYALRDESITLDVYAPTLPELEAEAKSEIAFLWREYALADDATLSRDALALKRALLDRFEAIPGHV